MMSNSLFYDGRCAEKEEGDYTNMYEDICLAFYHGYHLLPRDQVLVVRPPGLVPW